MDTEIPPPPLKKLLPRPRAVSNRSVSFDQTVDAAFLGINGTAQPQQPLSTMRQISTASTNRWEKLSLSDIVSPMESEAETAIFRAVEAHRRQQSTTTDIILPIIPNDTVHSFEQETTPTWGLEASESDDDKKRDQYSVPSSLLGSVSIATPPKQPNNVGHSAAPPSPARSKQSTSSHARAGPPKNTTAANDSTLEGTLFGLSAAMRDIHSTSNEASALADSMESRRRRLASSDVGRPGNTGWEVEAHTRDQDALFTMQVYCFVDMSTHQTMNHFCTLHNKSPYLMAAAASTISRFGIVVEETGVKQTQRRQISTKKVMNWILKRVHPLRPPMLHQERQYRPRPLEAKLPQHGINPNNL